MLAISGGTLYTITHGVRQGYTVLVREDKIEAIIPDASLPSGYEEIDAAGKCVLPGLIDARTSVGLFGDGSGFQCRP
jgi:imidazolonepropionase-like amidohydrolase